MFLLSDQVPNLRGEEGRRPNVRTHRSDVRQSSQFETLDDDARQQWGIADLNRDRSGELFDILLAAFQFDIEKAVKALKTPKGFPQRRYPLVREGWVGTVRVPPIEPRTHVHGLQFVRPDLPYLPFPPGDAVQRRIVKHYRDAVRRKLHVELDTIRPEVDGSLKRCEGVLGRINARPAVG